MGETQYFFLFSITVVHSINIEMLFTLYFYRTLPEGRSLAGMLSCKYTETSAALHHNTQELLDGVVRQIRLRKDEVERPPQTATLLPPGRRESLTKRARRLLQGIMGKHKGFFKQRSKSCHDLSVL